MVVIIAQRPPSSGPLFSMVSDDKKSLLLSFHPLKHTYVKKSHKKAYRASHKKSQKRVEEEK